MERKQVNQFGQRGCKSEVYGRKLLLGIVNIKHPVRNNSKTVEDHGSRKSAGMFTMAKRGAT
jgi:hypothetical protein